MECLKNLFRTKVDITDQTPLNLVHEVLNAFWLNINGKRAGDLAANIEIFKEHSEASKSEHSLEIDRTFEYMVLETKNKIFNDIKKCKVKSEYEVKTFRGENITVTECENVKQKILDVMNHFNFNAGISHTFGDKIMSSAYWNPEKICRIEVNRYTKQHDEARNNLSGSSNRPYN